MQYTVAIDPGLSGALCLYNNTTQTVEQIIDMPVKKIPKTSKKILDPVLILATLSKWSGLTDVVYIENQTITNRDGNKAALTTLKNYGILLGLLYASKYKITEVSAVTWQNTLLKGVVDPLTPARLKPSKRKSLVFTKQYGAKNDGQADAICIAIYGASLI